MVFTDFQICSQLYSALNCIDSPCPDSFITTYCDRISCNTNGNGTFQYTFSLPTVMRQTLGSVTNTVLW